MRISDWSSDVCSSDLETQAATGVQTSTEAGISVNRASTLGINPADGSHGLIDAGLGISYEVDVVGRIRRMIEVSATNAQAQAGAYDLARTTRSEEHTSELQSLMRISYSVFCLKT